MVECTGRLSVLFECTSPRWLRSQLSIFFTKPWWIGKDFLAHIFIYTALLNNIFKSMCVHMCVWCLCVYVCVYHTIASRVQRETSVLYHHEGHRDQTLSDRCLSPLSHLNSPFNLHFWSPRCVPELGYKAPKTNDLRPLLSRDPRLRWEAK